MNNNNIAIQSYENKGLTSFPLSPLQLPFKEKKKVKEFRIGRNRIMAIPDEIVKFTELEILHANENRITTITPKINKLKKLKRLNFYNNQITSYHILSAI